MIIWGIYMPVSKRRAGVKPKQTKRAKTNMSDKESQTPKKSSKTLTVKHIVPNNVMTLYSDNLLIQSRDAMFFMLFMQNQLPIAFSADDLRDVDSIESICFVRITTTTLQFARNIQAMEENFNRFLKAIGSPAKNYKEFLEMVDRDRKIK
jgi:hypothetical protein